MDMLLSGASRPGSSDDRNRAQHILKRLGLLRGRLDRWDGFKKRIEDLTELAALADDPPMSADLERDLAALTAEVEKASLEAQLSGPYDERGAGRADRPG